jgi:hypothetical protein
MPWGALGDDGVERWGDIQIFQEMDDQRWMKRSNKGLQGDERGNGMLKGMGVKRIHPPLFLVFQ